MTYTTPFARKARICLVVLPCLMILSTLLASCSGTGTNSSNNSSLTLLANTSGDYPRNFNPYAASVISGTQGMIYETLLAYNRLDGTIKPWLATSYSLNSNATSITFHLRQGVKWSDGSPLTSADVVFTLNLIKKYPGLDVNGIDPSIKDVVAPDTSTVTVTLVKPFNPILWFLGGQTYILAQHTWSKVKGDPSQYADPNPVGTGPYVLKSFTPQLVVLSKNSNYWQPGLPKVATLKIPAYNSNTSAELALESGQIDWTNLYIEDIQQSYVDRNKQDNHYWFPTSDIVYLYLNLTKFPFNMLPVREAISDAINRQQLYEVGESGYEPPATPTGLLPGNKSFLDPAYANLQFTFDPAKAISILESAGFKRGSDGIFAYKNGKKLAFNLNVVSGYTDWINDSQLMAKDLQNIGIKATVNTIEFDAYFNALQNGDYDTAMLWTNPGPTPYYLYDSLLDSVNSAPIGQAAATNYERWQDPTTDRLLQEFAATTNVAIQKQAMMGIEKIMVQQLPSIALTYEPYWYQYSTAKFVGWPDAQNPYAAPGTAEYPDIEYVVLNLRPVS